MQLNLKQYQDRAKEIEGYLSSADGFSNTQKIQELNREYAEIKEIIEINERIQNIQKILAETTETFNATNDDEMKQLANEEISQLNSELHTLTSALNELTNPADPLDKRNIIMEIRAGTGGDEAALFAAELFRMYARFAERQGWKMTLANSSRTDIGGFKEIVFSIEGKNAYQALKYESGVHRVQRIPETEKAGRVHTSTATVAVLPEAQEVEVKIEPKDLRIDTMTAGGHGGQSVNTTYSAVRITHLPTNTVIICQDERSQQQNKARAMQILRSRLFIAEQERLAKERGDERRSQIGTGERSEKIRTYNYPQDRVTDHRVKQNFHNLPQIMDGNIAEISKTLREANNQHDQH